jgi:AmpD protein
VTQPAHTGGWDAAARRCPSPNFNERPAGSEISLLVIHNISLPAGCFGTGHVEALFCNTLDCAAHPDFADLEGLAVSSHFLIERDGSLVQFVSCDQRAWHAGLSSWCGRDNCNDFSIGIELEGTDRQPYEDAQYRELVSLTRRLQRRYPSLAAGAIVGHSDIAPGRKTDPGPAFDWARFRSALRAGPTPGRATAS